MATEYLERLNAIMAQVQLQLPDGTSLECRHFFGGAAVYVKGRIFLTLTPVGFALKLPDVSPGNIDTLRKWVQLSVDYALSLPEKTLKVSKH